MNDSVGNDDESDKETKNNNDNNSNENNDDEWVTMKFKNKDVFVNKQSWEKNDAKVKFKVEYVYLLSCLLKQ